MAEVLQMQEAGQAPRKRKIGHKKGKGKKKMKVFQGSGQKVKMDGKTKKLFRKRARDYNSDDSDDDNDDVDEKPVKFENTSFKKAFKKIVNRSGTDDVLGPVLSAHKNLVVKKLAEEAAEKKVKGDAKKEKALLREKGHVKPDAFSVSHEKLLIGIATKGVVKLFNAVNKAQTSQKGLNPSRSKDAKVIQKRRKEAFFSELGKSQSGPDAKAGTSGNAGDEEGPAWAPLRDNYMLTTSKLKDWDKAADEPEAADDFGGQEDSSSEDDD
ncbi:putative ribosomal RNA-processing protein [Helianthus annuus]|nr:putative ribosomal RNA-processing protein [Helianthus annuus]